MSPLMTVDELSNLLNCSRSYIYRLVHERRIPFLKLGHRQLRFNPQEIQEWLSKQSHVVDDLDLIPRSGDSIL